MTRTLPALAVASLLLSACGAAEPSACADGGSSTMCPGSECLSCHGFDAAGTVFDGIASSTGVSSATVTFTDKNGAVVTRPTNSAGNFYTSTNLAFPLQSVTVSKGGTTVEMLDVPGGGCNGCHDAGSRIHLP